MERVKVKQQERETRRLNLGLCVQCGHRRDGKSARYCIRCREQRTARMRWHRMQKQRRQAVQRARARRARAAKS